MARHAGRGVPTGWREALGPQERGRLRPGRPGWRVLMHARRHEGALPTGVWAFERKFDGQRLLAVVADGQVRLWSRNRLDATGAYPEVAAALPADRDAVLDGEVVAFVGADPSARDDFALIQQRMHRSSPGPGAPEVRFLVFDLLHLDGQDVEALPLRTRKALLRDVGLQGVCAVVPHVEADAARADRLLGQACAAGWEGLMAKRPDAPYEHRRSGAWRKLKCVLGQEFLVCGYTPPQGSRAALGALLVGYRIGAADGAEGRARDAAQGTGDGRDGEARDRGTVRYAGKVGTGLDEAQLRSMKALLDGLPAAPPPEGAVPWPGARWVEPRVVCRVDFTEWTPDGLLRHPRFVALRTDKDPREVVREA